MDPISPSKFFPPTTSALQTASPTSPNFPPLSPFSAPINPKPSDLANPSTSSSTTAATTTTTPLPTFLQTTTAAFSAALPPPPSLALSHLSASLQAECARHLRCGGGEGAAGDTGGGAGSGSAMMLPSYNHTLPSGREGGTYLALDVGGSNLRVAIVVLGGVGDDGDDEVDGKDGRNGGFGRVGAAKAAIASMSCFDITERERALEGRAFFDWMAEKIEEGISLADSNQFNRCRSNSDHHVDEPDYVAGVAWSFPVEQTSEQGGSMLDMGKGFKAAKGILGMDIAELIEQSCRNRRLNIRVDSIINDGCATLLSQAYNDSTTRFGLILGTGTNISIMLPVTALSDEKFANRPATWREQAKSVLVNTEYSMLGKDVLPATKWDQILNENHLRPDFQPFEYMISGRYLGEIARLVLMEAIQTTDLFKDKLSGQFPEPYTFDTKYLAMIEADTSPNLYTATDTIQNCMRLNCEPSKTEVIAVQSIIKSISRRASILLATAIHALWCVRADAEGVAPAKMGRVAFGCNGSVIERYPGFLKRTQEYVDKLTAYSGASNGSVVLEIAVESAIYGAAVAVACLERDRSESTSR